MNISLRKFDSRPNQHLVASNAVKFRKWAPGLIFLKGRFALFGGACIWRGLSTEGNLRFKIDWASLIVGRKFTGFALFYFVFEGNFQVQAPGEAYILRGDLTEGFLRYEIGGLIFEGAYTWRGFFSEFYGNWGPRAVVGLTSVNG